MKELLKHFLSFGLATSLEKILLLGFIPLFSAFLSTEEFGAVDLLQVITDGVALFSLLQIETAFQRYYYSFKNKRKINLFSTSVIIVIILSILLSIIVIIFANNLSAFFFKDISYNNLLIFAILKLPFINFLVFGYITLRFEKQNKLFLVFILIRVLSLVLLTSAFLIIWDLGILGVVLGQLISSAITTFLMLFYIRKFFVIKISKNMMRRLLAYALPQFPARLGSFTLTYANRFFLLSFLTLSGIGVYSMSLRFAGGIQIIYTAFIMAWTPFLFENIKKTNHKKAFVAVFDMVVGPVALLVCLVTLFSSEIVTFFSNEKYMDATHYIGGLSLFYSLLIFKEIVDIGPKITNKTKFLTFNFFISVIVNLAALFILTPILGISGVVLAMLSANTGLLIISWIVSNNLYYIPFNIFGFFIRILPAYLLTIFTLFKIVSIQYRIIIALILISIYIFDFLELYKKNKNFVKLGL